MMQSRPATAARRRPLAVFRWLLALYVLALAVPVLEATVARAALDDATLVELCTGDGVRHIALDALGQPIEHVPTGQHAGHDCSACLFGCHHPAPGGNRLAQSHAWPAIAAPPSVAAAKIVARQAAHAPLPARGPPTLS
jgi:hypothetical protein